MKTIEMYHSLLSTERSAIYGRLVNTKKLHEKNQSNR